MAEPMHAVPPELDAVTSPLVAGLSCPDCCGMLSVRIEGKRGDLVFECRVGHTYSTDELLLGKEESLDERLWIAYTALEELVALLDDLDQRETSVEARRRYADRRERARAHAARLRPIIEENRPVALSEDDSPPIGCGP
jgi:two-component system chemotaxis response regulator CheB